MVLDRSASPAARHGHAVAVGAAVIAVGYAWVAGHFTTFTRPAEIATFVPGLLGSWVVVRGTSHRTARPDRTRVGWLGWWLIVVGLNAVELVSLALGPGHAHPTISDLVNPWLLSAPARAVGFALWLGLGYWLSRR